VIRSWGEVGKRGKGNNIPQDCVISCDGEKSFEKAGGEDGKRVGKGEWEAGINRGKGEGEKTWWGRRATTGRRGRRWRKKGH